MRNWSRKLAGMIRVRFDDRQRFLMTCIVCGLICGLLAVVFHLAIHYTFHTLWELARKQTEEWKFVLMMLFAPMLGGLVCGVSIKYWAPGAVGSGIPQTKEAYYNRGGKVPLSMAGWRFVLGTLFVGLGNALGREGPIVHASAALSSKLGSFMFKDPERVRAMIPVGMAAGIGAAFNAPLSALTFVFEELLDNFSVKAIGGMVVAVVIAAAVSRTILGENPVISTHLSLHYQTAGWMLVAIPLGALAGVIGHAFVESVLRLRVWVRKCKWMSSWYAPALGGLVCGALGLLAWWLTGLAGNAQNGVFSIGYGSLERAFESNLVIGALVALLVFKFIAVVVNYATGGSGGLFSPTLFLGGMLGGIVGIIFVNTMDYFEIVQTTKESQIIGGCVLLGMGAMFGSVVRCPFTSLIIIFEMTGNYSLILPLMAGNMLSWGIASRLRPVAIYDALLLDDGVSLKKMPVYRGSQDFRNLPVSAIMTHDVVSAHSWETARENLKRLGRSTDYHHAYTVVDETGRFLGIVTHHEIKEMPPEELLSEWVSQHQDIIEVQPEVSIREASQLMVAHDIQQLPVVSGSDHGRLLGIITMNDIARQRNACEI